MEKNVYWEDVPIFSDEEWKALEEWAEEESYKYWAQEIAESWDYDVFTEKLREDGYVRMQYHPWALHPLKEDVVNALVFWKKDDGKGFAVFIDEDLDLEIDELKKNPRKFKVGKLNCGIYELWKKP